MNINQRRGISPVIASIIIAAVAIAISIAVAYWIMGIGGAETKFENLKISACYFTKHSIMPIH